MMGRSMGSTGTGVASMMMMMMTTTTTVAVLFVVVPGLVPVAEGAKESAAEHKVRARGAVRDKYVEWLNHWGAKHQANKQAAALRSAQVVDIGTAEFENQLSAASKVIVVDKSGKGDVTTVQAAVDRVPKHNDQRIEIQINAGTYEEKIFVPSNKPYITFYGPAGAAQTILIWGDTAAKAGSTSKSASTTVKSKGFIARGISFRNSAPAPPGGAVGRQAVAFLIEGDMAQFYSCSFYGAQDTLYDKRGRHYWKDCFIQGSIDFIFGDGQSYYENCQLNVIAQPNSGSLTAQKRSKGTDDSGYSFVNCKVTGSGPVYLGRAWGPFSRVVFIQTYFEDLIIPAGWYDWGVSSRRKTVYYGQYQCSGPGANTKGRVNWAMELTAAQVEPFMTISFIDGSQWLSM